MAVGMASRGGTTGAFGAGGTQCGQCGKQIRAGTKQIGQEGIGKGKESGQEWRIDLTP